MFRRSSAGATDGKAQDPPGAQSPEAPAKTRSAAEAGKGRPTPKRSAAEANRYRTVTGSTTSGRGPTASNPKRKLTPEEKSRERAAQRAEQAKKTQALRRGEDWALNARDRGPVRRLARDYVDAHRRPMEFYMYALIFLVIALIGGKSAVGGYLNLFLLAIVAVVIVDAILLRRSVLKLLRERMPNESTRGIAFYAIMRALQLRRLRNPPAVLKPGDKY